jgi:S-DNA-T family DNA segregation ATPase FtsK/SpoIIIE
MKSDQKTGIRRRKAKKQKNIRGKKINSQIKAILWLALAVFIFAGVQFTAQTGYFGLLLNYFFRALLGEAALAFPFLLGVMAFSHFFPLKIENRYYRFAGLLLLLFLLAITLHLTLVLQEPGTLARENFYRATFHLGWQQQGGGLIGAALTVVLFFLFKDLGSYIVITAGGVIALLLITNRSLTEICCSVKQLGKTSFQFVQRLIINTFAFFSVEGSKEPPVENYAVQEYSSFEAGAEEGPGEEKEVGKKEEAEKEENPIINVYHNVKQSLNSQPAVPENGVALQAGGQGGGGLDPDPIFKQEPAPFQNYQVPSLALLTRINKLRDQHQQKIILERAKSLENTLASFGVNVKIKEIQAGPAVTRFEIQPETGVKVSRILSLSDDLALNLAASDVRIVAPIPGKAAVGIEVPNKIISVVYLKEVLEDPNFKALPSPLTIGLGKDIAGVSIFADLLKMPHLLIAGSTGSGKSVCINTIICSILFKASPGAVKFLLIDPKLVELSIYNGVPHLLSPVITEPKKAAAALRGMVKEMIRRYDLFARQGVRDISRYNELCQNTTNDAAGGGSLPYIVVIIDELADLMMVAPSEVEDSIVRLSQMSRAAGIHLVIATQRPSVDIITGLIKANITSRIAFAVSSQVVRPVQYDQNGRDVIRHHLKDPACL